jgi:hypothetical protein
MHIITVRVLVDDSYLKRDSSGQARVKRARCYNLNWGDPSKWITSFESPAKVEARQKLLNAQEGIGSPYLKDRINQKLKEGKRSPSRGGTNANYDDSDGDGGFSDNDRVGDHGCDGVDDATAHDEDRNNGDGDPNAVSTTETTPCFSSSRHVLPPSKQRNNNSKHPWDHLMPSLASQHSHGGSKLSSAALSLSFASAARTKSGPALTGSAVLGRRVVGVREVNGGAGSDPEKIARELAMPSAAAAGAAPAPHKLTYLLASLKKPAIPPPPDSFLIEMAKQAESARFGRAVLGPLDDDDDDDDMDGDDDDDDDDMTGDDERNDMDVDDNAVVSKGAEVTVVKKSLNEEWGAESGGSEAHPPAPLPPSRLATVEEAPAAAAAASSSQFPPALREVLLKAYQSLQNYSNDDGALGRREVQYSSAREVARKLREAETRNFELGELEDEALERIEIMKRELSK